MSDCVQPLNDDPVNPPSFCVKTNDPQKPIGVHACILGPRESCTCRDAKEECPDPEPLCLPNDESCPAAVQRIAPDARCPRPPAEAFSTQAKEGCLCGCVACARICDGQGPALGLKFPSGAGDPPAPLAVSLSALPASGRLGVYVRIRGIASLSLVVGRERTPLLAQPIQVINQTQFVELTFGPTNPWTEPSMAPDLVVLLAQPGPTEAEVDCIVPFLLAP